MTTKVYISNISVGWPVESQEQMLVDFMREVGIYRDHISSRAQRELDATVLKERPTLLGNGRPGIGDRLVVASLACLAFPGADLLDVLVEAERHGLTIMEVHTGREFPPLAGAALVAEAINLLKADRLGPSRLKGRERAAEIKIADTERRLDLIRPYWVLRTATCLYCKGSGAADPTLSVESPANEMCPACKGTGVAPVTINYLRTLGADAKGRPMARATLYERLGKPAERLKAQRAYEDRIEREEASMRRKATRASK